MTCITSPGHEMPAPEAAVEIRNGGVEKLDGPGQSRSGDDKLLGVSGSSPIDAPELAVAAGTARGQA